MYSVSLCVLSRMYVYAVCAVCAACTACTACTACAVRM